jgi:hypothetical protein
MEDELYPQFRAEFRSSRGYCSMAYELMQFTEKRIGPDVPLRDGRRRPATEYFIRWPEDRLIAIAQAKNEIIDLPSGASAREPTIVSTSAARAPKGRARKLILPGSWRFHPSDVSRLGYPLG